MNLGIVICSYNRPEYLRQCFNSLRRADLGCDPPKFLIVDDCSTDAETKKILANSDSIIYNEKNSGISFSLKTGYNWLFENGCDVVMNLDGDTIVKKDFIDKLIPLYNQFPDHPITGFNCLTKNRDGSERHKIISQHDGYSFKKSVTGIHMMMNESVFRKYMEPSLSATLSGGNWDHLTGIAAEKDGHPTVCIIPSVVQHIGIHSSLGHNEAPDIADDFVRDKLQLPNVTLVGITGTELSGMIKAVDISTKNIDFGAVKIITSQVSLDPRVQRVPFQLNSKDAYNEFMMHQLANYIETDYTLIVQPDGYVVNALAWNDEFFNYDYIGAVWNWYPDKKVGNGGFSFRSKRLHEILRDDKVISEIYPEDHVIGRTYRNYLEEYHSIKFAPEEIANQFSVENYKVPAPKNKYNGSFGFHGFLTDFAGANIDHIPYVLRNGRRINEPAKPPARPIITRQSPKKLPIILSQHFGLGDILFCMTIANDYIAEGNEVLWPVMKQYVSIQKHFPQIKFVDFTTVNINQEKKMIRDINLGKVIPLRWSEKILRKSYADVMRAKYDLLNKDFIRWRELNWVRDTTSEDQLFSYLGLKEGDQYNFINNTFRNDQTGKTKIEVNNGLKNIEMREILAFTLLDWGKVIENATSIHTVSTSLSYLIDVMKTTDDLHQYLRKPDEKDFKMTEYLWQKKYEFHY